MAQENPVQTGYYTQLDALRFFSVAAVMIAHWVAWDSNNFLLKTMHWGNGVIFFFVLSGFLITEILLKQKQEISLKQKTIGQSLKTFYIRRTLRIFPVYYILIFYLFYIGYRNTRDIFPYLATYTSNIFQATSNDYVGDFNHFWSLAVEEQFYIFWPVCIFLVAEKHLLKFIVATIILSVISRLGFVYFYPEKWMAASYLVNNIMFALSIGALLAYLKKHNTTLFLKISSSVIATPLIIGLYLLVFFCVVHQNYFPAINFLFDEFLFSLVAFIILARCTGSGYKFAGKWLLENKTLRHLGQITYGLYLFHLFAINVFYDYISPKLQLHTEKKQTAWLLFFLFTWIAAELSYAIIEKPINNLKKYFKY